jgi:hypothetical protein
MNSAQLLRAIHDLYRPLPETWAGGRSPRP